MTRVNEPLVQAHARLVKAGIDLKHQQVANVLANRLGPSDDASDSLAHWRALSELRRGPSMRLPEGDEAAMALAVKGFFCQRLPDAVARLFGATEGPSLTAKPGMTAPEMEAEQFLAQSCSSGDEREKSHNERFAARIVNDSKRAGPVRPGYSAVETSAEDLRLERLGQAQAFVTEIAEVLGGAPAADAIDGDDVAAVIGVGLTADYFETAANLCDRIFGTGWLNGAETRVRNANPATLVAVVQAAHGMMPLYEEIIVPVGIERDRWRVVAKFVPVLLALSDLLSMMGGQVAPLSSLVELLTTAVRSLVTPEAPALD